MVDRLLNRFLFLTVSTTCFAIASPRIAAADNELVEKLIDVKEIAASPKVGAALVECITSCIAPTDWDSVGGNATIEFRRREIAVSASADVHTKIEKLVKVLRELPNAGTKEARAIPKTPRMTVAAAANDSEKELAVYPVGDFLNSTDRYPDLDLYIELVSRIVSPASWDAVGGEGQLTEFRPRGVLVVAQSKEVIEQLDSLFAALRKAPAIAKEMLDKVPTTPAIVAFSIKADEEAFAAVVYPVADLATNGKSVWRREEDGMQNYDLGSLIDVITEQIDPRDWGCGGIIEFDRRMSLVVVQSADVHKKIEALLAALRKIPRYSAATKKAKPQPPTPVGDSYHGYNKLQVVVYDVGARILNSKGESDFAAIILAVIDVNPSSWNFNDGPGCVTEYHGRGALIVANTRENQALVAKAIEKFKLPKD